MFCLGERMRHGSEMLDWDEVVDRLMSTGFITRVIRRRSLFSTGREGQGVSKISDIACTSKNVTGRS